MNTTINSPPSVQRPTRVRLVVVGLAILLGMVTYLDRGAIQALAKHIRGDLGLSEDGMNWVFALFAIAYGTTGIPCAWWANRVGTRKMLTAVVVAWSAFTIATGAAMGLVSLLAIRFCFGVGEAGAWPAITRTLSRWIPYRERGTAQGVVWIGAHLTVFFTPALVTLLNSQLHLSWRWIFFLFGLVGLFWATGWYWWFRDEPSQHRQVNAAELAHIMAGRKSAEAEEHPPGWSFWRRLLTHRNVLALCLMYLPNSFIFYFCITRFREYLSDGRKMDGLTLDIFTGLPLLLSVVADLLGGTTTDWAVRRVGPRWGRAGVGFVSYAVAGITILLAALTEDARLAATLFAIGTAANMFVLASAWGTCQDIGGGHAGVVSATMNTAGQAAAAICPHLVTFVKDRWHSWDAPSIMLGAWFLAASVCWCLIDPRKKVFD